jgi:hypothetical protein
MNQLMKSLRSLERKQPMTARNSSILPTRDARLGGQMNTEQPFVRIVPWHGNEYLRKQLSLPTIGASHGTARPFM